MAKTFKNRKDIDSQYKWTIEDMYPAEEKWEEDLNRAISLAENTGNMKVGSQKTVKPFWNPSSFEMSCGKSWRRSLSMPV